MNKVLNFLNVHKVWLSTVGAGVVLFLTPSVNALVAAHPQYAVSIGTLWAALAAWAKFLN